MQELRRIINYKRIILLLLAATVNIVFFLYGNKPVKDADILYRENAAHTAYIEEYPDEVSAITDNAEKLKKYSIFNKAGSFSYANILQTAKDFERVKDVVLPDDEYKGVQAHTAYYYQYFFTMIVMMFVIYDMFAQRDNGMWSITYSCANGRALYAVKQTGVLAVAGAFTHTLIYWSTFIAAMLQGGGFKDLGNPIQTIEAFGKFTYPWSKIKYVVVLYLVSMLCIIALCIIIWAVFVIFRNRVYALVTMLIFAAEEQFIYSHIDIHSVFNWLHYINIINIININATFSSYRNWGVGTYVFPVFSVVLFVHMICACIMAYIAVNVSETMKPHKNTTFVKRFTDWVSGGCQKILARLPLLVKEMHKFIFTTHCGWVVVVMLIVTAYVCQTGQYYYTDDNKYMDREYAEHGGTDYTYFQNYLDDLYRQRDELQSEIDSYGDVMTRDEDIDIQTYINLKTKQQQLLKLIESRREYADKIEYIGHIDETYGVKAWMISDRGYEVISGGKGMYRRIMVSLALICGLMLMAADSGLLEGASGMILFERSTALGRNKMKRNKYLSCIIIAVIMSVVICGMEFLWMWHIYGMPYLNAPLVSLTFMGNKLGRGLYSAGAARWLLLHVTICQYMIMQYIAKLVICLVLSVGTMRITRGMKNLK